MSICTHKHIRFTVCEYIKMSDAGLFDDRRRVELIDGRIIQSKRLSHNEMVVHTKVSHLLYRHFGDLTRFWPTIRGTYIMGEFDAPDPDFYVLDAPIGTRDSECPSPFLVIEVAERTHKRDSGIKLRRYAAAGVKDYWIINIPKMRVEVYREPQNTTGRKRDWHFGQSLHFGMCAKVQLLAHPTIEFPVRDMLP